MFDDQPQQKRDENVEDWMTTYADMVTLLLAFFVLLASISKVDIVLFEQVKAGMAKGIGNREVQQPLDQIKVEMEDLVSELQIDDIVGVGNDTQGLVLDFAGSGFYKPGTAEIREEAIPILKRVAATLQQRKYERFQVEVQGHTDDSPISSSLFPSNWELSGARAARVVRFFIDEGVKTTRLKSIGFADTIPKVPNHGPDGTPIPMNREINRRVVVRIYPAG
jgi:chemotaxis protein MotB